jgi:hypothetical protein
MSASHSRLNCHVSEALQRNAKHEARLSNISAYFCWRSLDRWSEILRFAQNDSDG